jgi:hypothetical protein
MRTKEIYDGLKSSLEEQCKDEPWINGMKRKYNLNENEWTADRVFLITISWGPWREPGRMKVWDNLKESFPDVIEDIRNADQNFDSFRLSWQNKRVIAVSQYLNREALKSFKEVLKQIQAYDGAKACDFLAKISGAKQEKKTISCFVRDFLLKESFPIDSRVEKMLSGLGLPNNEDQIIKLCKMDKVSSRILDRMLYMQWDICHLQVNSRCGKCRIKKYCWEYILK